MGAFDFFLFVTAPDGRTVFFPFFPWGVCGRGYVVGSEADVARLRRLIAISYAICTGLIMPLVVLPRAIAGLVLLAIIASYYLIMRHVLRRLQPPAVQLTLRESMIMQARAHSQMALSLAVFASVAFVGLSAFVIFIDRSSWSVGAFAIVFFGLGGFSYVAVLIMQWTDIVRARREPAEP
jgi:hypothetical protein